MTILQGTVSKPPIIARLRRDRRGVAALEFALSAPIVLALLMGGIELTNYTITKMRVSQIALHVADNASRIGTDSLLTSPEVSERQVNDLFSGADLQGGGLDIKDHGRLILSSFEPMAHPNPSGRYKIHWQRCSGGKHANSRYGNQGRSDMAAMGPPGRRVKPPDNGAVMYVEITYDYQPIFFDSLAPSMEIHDVAAMVVRGDRDFDGNHGVGLYNREGVAASTCS